MLRRNTYHQEDDELESGCMYRKKAAEERMNVICEKGISTKKGEHSTDMTDDRHAMDEAYQPLVIGIR